MPLPKLPFTNLKARLVNRHKHAKNNLCKNYTMDCPPVRVDNPRALASGLSYAQVGKHGITILYHLLTHNEIFRAKVGKSVIKLGNI